MPRIGSRRKKTKTHVKTTEEQNDTVPKSMIIKRTSLDKDLKMLEKELRDVLYPFTAIKYKESTKLRLKEVIFGAKAFGVKNLFLLSSKDKGDYLKFTQISNGPTFTFKIVDFSLISDLLHGGINSQLEDIS